MWYSVWSGQTKTEKHYPARYLYNVSGHEWDDKVEYTTIECLARTYYRE